MKNKWIRRGVNCSLLLVLMFAFSWSVLNNSFFIALIVLFIATFYFQDNNFFRAVEEERVQEFLDNMARVSDDKNAASGNK